LRSAVLVEEKNPTLIFDHFSTKFAQKYKISLKILFFLRSKSKNFVLGKRGTKLPVDGPNAHRALFVVSEGTFQIVSDSIATGSQQAAPSGRRGSTHSQYGDGQLYAATEYTRGDVFGQLAPAADGSDEVVVECVSAGKVWIISALECEKLPRVHAVMCQFLDRAKELDMLSPSQKRKICSVIQEKRISAGTVLVKRGEHVEGIYFHKSGTVIQVEEEGGAEVQLNPGSAVGINSLVCGLPSKFTVTATTSAAMFFVPHASLRRIGFQSQSISASSSPTGSPRQSIQIQKSRNSRNSTRSNDTRDSLRMSLRFAPIHEGGKILLETLQKSLIRHVLSRSSGLKQFSDWRQDCLVRSAVIQTFSRGEVIADGDESAVCGCAYVVLLKGEVENEKGETFTAPCGFGDPLQSMLGTSLTITSFEAEFGLLTCESVYSVLTSKGQDEMLTDTNLQFVLARCIIFSVLSEDQRWSVIRQGRIVQHSEGDIIMEKGDLASQFFIVISGRVEVSRGNSTRELGSLEYFGERALLLDSARELTVKVLEKTTLWTCHKNDFLPFVTMSEALREHFRMGVKLKDAAVEITSVSQLERVRLLGCGAYGRVHLVEAIGDDLECEGVHFALKCLDKKQIEELGQVERVKAEREALAS